jgi:hypothetical protein
MVRYAAESGSELSYGNATGMTLMTETVAPITNPVPRPRPRKPASVSASALALHLDCSRAYIGKLEAEGVIQRQGDGFPLDHTTDWRSNCAGPRWGAPFQNEKHAFAVAGLR